jgi:hypothetical protein
MWAGADWTWHLPVRRNDAISTEAWLKELIERETRFAGRSIQQVYHVDFHNQRGEMVASADSWCFRTDRDQAREQGSKYDAVKGRPPHYSEADLIASIGSMPRRRCAGPLRGIGATLPSVIACR